MKKFLIAALAGLFATQPAGAATVLGDYTIYADGNAYISGGAPGNYGKIASGSFTNANGAGGNNYQSVTTSSAALTQQAHDLSTKYSGLASTQASGVNQWGHLTITGTQSDTNVFNIDGSTWQNIYKLTFAGPGTGAIVNVSGLNLDHYVDLDFGALTTENVVFNFYQADKVAMGGMTIRGSILAPDAYVNLQGGNVLGTVISDSFRSEGTTFGGKAYTGFTTVTDAVSGAVPEPSTWALMILGFGLIGAALRRRVAATPQVAFAA